jgi:hypothetical protein
MTRDTLSIRLFTECDKWASRAINGATEEANAYLSNYPANRVVSVTSQVSDFVDKGGDYPVGVVRCTVTVVVREAHETADNYVDPAVIMQETFEEDEYANRTPEEVAAGEPFPREME